MRDIRLKLNTKDSIFMKKKEIRELKKVKEISLDNLVV